MAGRKGKSRAAAIEEALMGLGCPFVGQLRLDFDEEPMPRQDPTVVLLIIRSSGAAFSADEAAWLHRG
jgi:hypothetical protein